MLIEEIEKLYEKLAHQHTDCEAAIHMLEKAFKCYLEEISQFDPSLTDNVRCQFDLGDYLDNLKAIRVFLNIMGNQVIESLEKERDKCQLRK